MNLKLVSVAVIVPIFLSGCAETPYAHYQAGKPINSFLYKAGTNDAMRANDITTCQVDAAQRVPQNMVLRTTPAYTTPVQTTCNRIGTQTFCNSYGGDTYGGQTYSEDANSGLRTRAYLQCLGNMGYSLPTIPACPKGTTFSDLDQSNVLEPYSNRTCYFVTPEGQGAVGNLRG